MAKRGKRVLSKENAEPELAENKVSTKKNAGKEKMATNINTGELVEQPQR